MATEQSTQLLTVPEAAAMLRIGRTRAYRLAKAGALPCIRIGASVRVPLAAVQRMVEEANHGR